MPHCNKPGRWIVNNNENTMAIRPRGPRLKHEKLRSGGAIRRFCASHKEQWRRCRKTSGKQWQNNPEQWCREPRRAAWPSRGLQIVADSEETGRRAMNVMTIRRKVITL
jgi:hypothetical protein